MEKYELQWTTSFYLPVPRYDVFLNKRVNDLIDDLHNTQEWANFCG